MNTPDGRHLSFPFRVGSDGRTAGVGTLEEHVRQELIQLILTNPGERAFLPEFGGGARRLVFENMGSSTAHHTAPQVLSSTSPESTTPSPPHTVAMAKAMLSQALTRWLGHRITVEDLVVETENEKLFIDLKYRIAGTPDSRRLRFERRGS